MGCGSSSSHANELNAPHAPHEPHRIRPEDMDEEERSAIAEGLHAAAKAGNVEELSRLLSTEKGRACINEGDESGITPLHFAASYSKLEAVKLLVEMGAAAFGTPLTSAAKYGYDSMAEYLLSKGASKEKAIENANEYDKALVEGFFVELERINQNRSVFKTMREELKVKMMSSEPGTLPTTTKGITIAGLKKMSALIQSECEAGRFKDDMSFPDGTECKGTMVYKELTTTDIVYRYVKDASVTGNLRLIDAGIVAPEHKALPTLFISHAWKGRFSVLLDKIYAYAQKRGLSDETAMWIDVFSVNQHGSKECSEFSQAQNRADVASFKDVVQTCIDGTLVICDFEACAAYSRAW